MVFIAFILNLKFELLTHYAEAQNAFYRLMDNLNAYMTEKRLPQVRRRNPASLTLSFETARLSKFDREKCLTVHSI